MKRYFFPVVVVAALAACDTAPTDVPTEASPSMAVSGGVFASVVGSGHIPQGEEDRRAFSFAAAQRADGSVTGQFTLLITRSVLGSENPSITRIEADVTCMSTSGNRAWVGGVVTNASNPDWIGLETGWAVEDNGEGRNSFDLISLMDIPGPPGLAQSVCDARARVPNLLISTGNVQVSVGGPQNDQFFPFAAFVGVCGDFVEFVGTLHPVFRFSEDGSGGFHAKGHYNATGTGVSVFGDAVYNWNDAINFSASFRPPQETFTDQQSFLLVGRGQAPNQTLHLNTHITVTPDGVLRVIADNFRIDCR
ncbi:MAG: hypothetical protein R3253_17505 [Longimicrobiales bacterium]|nr:hypothetical protein [Longimicrobiales bacterium]